MRQKFKRWVILGDNGLYTGQWHRRTDAIRKHTADLWSGRDGLPELSDFGSLTKAHRDAWARCRRAGDRAVIATVYI